MDDRTPAEIQEHYENQGHQVWVLPQASNGKAQLILALDRCKVVGEHMARDPADGQLKLVLAWDYMDITTDFMTTFAAKRGLELTFSAPENVSIHLLNCRMSEVAPVYTIRCTDRSTRETKVAIMYKRPEPKAS